MNRAHDAATLAAQAAAKQDFRGNPVAKPLASTMASPADQASEIAWLRRELGRAWMERDS